MFSIQYRGVACRNCDLKYRMKVGVEESIVNVPRIIDQFKSNFPFCVVCVFTLEADEWSVHNRLFNAKFEEK
jgi:hypothetical protein